MKSSGARREKSPGAAREALRRQRERLGIRVYPVEVYDTTIEALIDMGLVTEFDAADKTAISRALGSIIDQVRRAAQTR